jgi:hypothetical protein
VENRYSTTTVLLVGVATLLMGMLIGIGLTLWVRPIAAPETEETVAESPEEEAEPESDATAEASASAAPAKTVDAAAEARFRKLTELRKKIKGRRAKDMDAQCKKSFKTQRPAGYVYDGGSFQENEFVANAVGCVALAKTTKAPWFCCAK